MAGKRGTPDSAAPAASGAATSTARVVRSLQCSRLERRTVYLIIGAVLGIWLFRSSLQWPGDNPVMRAVNAIESSFEGLQRRRKAGAK